MNPLKIKRELLDSTAQVIIFDIDGKLLSSCDSIFSLILDKTTSLFDTFSFLESLQEPLMQFKEGDELELDCMWFEYANTAGYFDFKLIKKDSMFVWFLQDFNKIYTKLIPVQQERNESIINSEILELHRKTKEKLIKTENAYSYLFNNTPDLIQSTDLEGRFIFTNPAWHKDLNYSEEEVSNINFFDLVHPNDLNPLKQLLKSLNVKKNLQFIELKLLKKTGGYIYVRGSINAFFNKEKLVSYQSIYRNVTKRVLVENKLKQSEALYRLLVENASDIIYMTDTNRKITYMNPVGLKFKGNSEEGIKSIDFAEWIHPNYKVKIKKFYSNQINQKINSTYQEFPIIVKNKTVWIGQHVNLLFNIEDEKKHISGFLVIARDITKQKKLEDALNNTNVILDSKVKERTLALNQSNKELTLVNNELDNFLYKSSHNLKGPIARISGLSHLMKMNTDKTTILDTLNYIDKEVLEMNGLIEQLTSYHLIYSSNPSDFKEGIDLKKLLNSLALTGEIKTAGANCCTYNVDVANNVHLVSNKVLLSLALGNVLANSFQFANKALENHIVKTTVKTDRDWVKIVIRDNGEGISKALLPDIFNMFFKGSLNQHRHGLGLYLAKKATEKINGKISVISKEGEFTEFTIALPNNL